MEVNNEQRILYITLREKSEYFPSVLPERQCSLPLNDAIRNRALDEELVSLSFARFPFILLLSIIPLRDTPNIPRHRSVQTPPNLARHQLEDTVNCQREGILRRSGRSSTALMPLILPQAVLEEVTSITGTLFSANNLPL